MARRSCSSARRSHWQLHRIVPVEVRAHGRDARRSLVGSSRSRSPRSGISVTVPHDPFEAHPKAFHLNESQSRMPTRLRPGLSSAMKVYGHRMGSPAGASAPEAEGYIVASENCWPDPIVASVAGALPARSVWSCRRSAWRCGSPARSERGAEKGLVHRDHDVFRVGEHRWQGHARAQRSGGDAQSDRTAPRSPRTFGASAGPSSARTPTGNPVQAMSGLWVVRDRLQRGGRANRSTIGAGVGAGRVGARASRAEIRRHHWPSSGPLPIAARSTTRWTGLLTPTSGGRTQLALFDGARLTNGRPTEDPTT